MRSGIRRIVWLPAALLLASCSSSGVTSRAVLDEAAQEEFGSSSYGCAETVAVAAKAGYDYGKVVDGCLARDAESLRTFFWLTKYAGFDAASAQGHAAVCGILLRRLGDPFFGECLAKESATIRDAVREGLLYDLGYGNTGITLDQIKKEFPLTFPADWHESESGEAGQCE